VAEHTTNVVNDLTYQLGSCSKICKAYSMAGDESTDVKNTAQMHCVHVKWVPVTMAWRVLRLRMEEWPPGMEGSCEYIK
jgi:hypothetical protein